MYRYVAAIDAAGRARLLRALFVALFLAILVLPAVQAIKPIIEVAPVEDNRPPAPPPDFDDIVLTGNGRLAPAVNVWFDDHLSLRSLFIRLHNQLDYWLFRHSDKVYIGSDGMLFLRSDVDKRALYQQKGDDFQRDLRAQFVKLARWLDRRGVRLVVVSNPIKASVFPEQLPSDVPVVTSPTQFDRLRTFLAAGNEWIYVDGQDVMPRCGTYTLFYRTDIHSTSPAISCIAKEVVARIAVAEGRPATFWQPHFTFHEQGFLGGLTKFMAVLTDPGERVDAPDPQPAPEGSFLEHPQPPFEMIWQARPSLRDSKLPPVVLYGNSFVDYYLQAGFYFQFGEVYRVRNNRIPVETVLEKLPAGTRYFVFQFLEVYLDELRAYHIPDE